MTVEIYRFVYRCLLRLHDILFFLWVERWSVSVNIIKAIAALAIIGVVLVIVAEYWPQRIRQISRHARQAPRTFRVEAIPADEESDDEDLVTVVATGLRRRGMHYSTIPAEDDSSEDDDDDVDD